MMLSMLRDDRKENREEKKEDREEKKEGREEKKESREAEMYEYEKSKRERVFEVITRSLEMLTHVAYKE